VGWESLTAISVVGSHDSSFRLKTHSVNDSGGGTYVYFDGTPVKFLQGHNLFGTDNLILLLSTVLKKITSIPELGLNPTDFDVRSWEKGNFKLNRVDCTAMFDVGNTANALSWIRQAEMNATLSHRGRGQVTKGSTLYFGKSSRRSSVKFYAKGEEFQKHSHAAFLQLPALVDYANRGLRCEVVLRSLELNHRGLSSGSAWDDLLPLQIVNDFIGRINMADITAITSEETENLPASLKAVYELWKMGHDIRAMYPRRTFYRYRKGLMDSLGIDIATVQYKQTDNVVPFVRIIEAKPMGIPDWAFGTDLYFDGAVNHG
ncbi:phage/plasmid replication protein, II/X family, partial [Enterobacter hormaechei]|uniref:phage/plasmid replication protein, II/X family n=2 Tax=Enterobacteriaceae TaxID=543 RepID=UPI001780AF34